MTLVFFWWLTFGASVCWKYQGQSELQWSLRSLCLQTSSMNSWPCSGGMDMDSDP